MKLSKRDDIGRKLRSVVRHTLMLTRPAIITALTAMGWWFFRDAGYYFPENEPFEAIVTVILVLGVPFGILAAEAVRTAWNKHAQVTTSVLTRNRRQFLLYRDERILTAMHVLLAVFASLVIVVVSFFHYKEAWVGLMMVTVTTFSLSLVWSVIEQLENPRLSPWIRERIPAEWFEEDVDKFFLLEVKNNGRHKKKKKKSKRA